MPQKNILIPVGLLRDTLTLVYQLDDDNLPHELVVLKYQIQELIETKIESSIHRDKWQAEHKRLSTLKDAPKDGAHS